MLRRTLRQRGPFDDDRVDRLLQQFAVVNVGSGSLNAQGSVTLGGTATLQVTLSAPPVLPYKIINKTSAGAVSGTFANSLVTAVYGAKTYTMNVRYAGGNGNDVELFMPSGTVLTIK